MSRYPKFYLGADGRQYEEAAYRLTGPVQIDDIRWEEGEELIYPGWPNEAMQPLNVAAAQKYSEWLQSLPGAGQAKADDLMQAAWELRNSQPSQADNPQAYKDWQIAVFARALEVKTGSAAKRPSEMLEPKAYRPSHEVPPMSNMNVSTGTAAPAPKNSKPRTAARLPQDQRPRASVSPMGSTNVGTDQLPTS